HGWSSGVTAWLTENILGVKVLEPGCRALKIKPHMGRLKWVEGSYPTPLGTVRIKHTRKEDGTIHSEVYAPEGIRIEQ
ncbi:MAG: alpha-L-rhamnosidase C-terminal domain-containing protein, partial [Mangrovibacterium sp.]